MQVEGAQLDGMICLASCDKTAPGQLMAAARLNIPTIIVACGYQASGSYRGRHCDIEDVFLAAGPRRQRAAQRRRADRDERQRGASPGRVRRASAPPTRCTWPARRSAWRCRDPRRSGRTASRCGGRSTRRPPASCEMVAEDLKPRDIMTPGGVRERGHRHLVGQRVDQLGQAPAGGRGRGRVRRGRLPAVRDPGRRRAAAHRDQAQRRDADRGLRGRRRHPGADEAARAAARRRGADGDRADRGGEPRRGRGRRRGDDQAARAGARAAADDRADPRQPLPRRRDRQAGRRRRPAA